jgi:FkbM family methyltransferase
MVPVEVLGPDSVCYCFGVGENITFDLELANSVGCNVYAFDPTPRAIIHARTVGGSADGFHFSPVGVWDKDESVRFYAPANPSNVSHSALNLQRTGEFFEAPCRTVGSIMREYGHRRLDLLKLDVEGAEYRVIASLLRDGIDITILCVEFDEAFHRLDSGYVGRIRLALRSLEDAGYRLIAADLRCNYTLVRG